MFKPDPSTDAGIEALIASDEPLSSLTNWNVIQAGRQERRECRQLIDFFAERDAERFQIGDDLLSGKEIAVRLQNGARLELFRWAHQRRSGQWR